MRLVFACVVCVGACGSENEYAALFDAPMTTPTPGLHGTWGGEVDFIELRWVFAPDRATFAARCGDRVVGIDIEASVSDTEIRFLEAAMDGDERCRVHTNVATVPACTTGYTECFRHDGLMLEFFGTGDSARLMKLSDETP